ncbi:MAG: hypothetical protein R2867_07510 [Caldilineaceae bacterium]
MRNDTRGTLQAVAEMGYDGVEFAGMPNNGAEELKAMLDEMGLACCGWHTPLALVQDDKLAATIAFHQTLGNDKLIIPGSLRNCVRPTTIGCVWPIFSMNWRTSSHHTDVHRLSQPPH